MNNVSEIGNNIFALLMGTFLVIFPIIMACMFNKGLKTTEKSFFPNLAQVPKTVTVSNSESVSTAVHNPDSVSLSAKRIQMKEGGEIEEEPTHKSQERH
jgi:hypothetical protein